MKSKPPYLKSLREKGIIQLKCTYSKETLELWNRLLDPVFREKSDEERAYIRIDQLYSLGILEDFFNPSMQGFIYQVMPDAMFYHCHAYEIESRRTKPHVHDNWMNGWHQDEDILGQEDPSEPNHLSLFVYLSEVNSDDYGPFECLLRSPHFPIESGLDSVKIMGGIGTTWVFNRAFYHRPTPNMSSVRRRVLKISLSHKYTFTEEHFLFKDKKCQEIRHSAAIQGNTFLAYLLGGNYHTSGTDGNLPEPHNYELPPLIELTSNSKTKISSLALLRHRLRGIKDRVLKPLKSEAY